MATTDKAVLILDAINTAFVNMTATGEVLEDIGSYFVKYTESDLPPEFGSVPPVLIAEPLDVPGETISIPPCFTEKRCPVRFRVYTENAGDTTEKTAANLIDTLETLLYQQGFGIAEWVDMTSKNYSIPASPPFEFPVNGGAELIITYTYTHVQDVPTQGIPA